MRVVVQRVKSASVDVIDRISVERTAQISSGFLVLIAVENTDTNGDADWLATKIAQMRVFEDDCGKMNRSILESGGDIVAVSQFTLYGNMKKGNRPSFNRSAAPDVSRPLYDYFCVALSEKLGKPVGRGVFGAMMEVSLVNDGPVTVILDSRVRDL